MSTIPTACDLETHLIKAGLTTPKMVCLTTANGTGDPKIYLREEGLDAFTDILRHKHSVGHHYFFDLAVVAAERPELLPDIFQALDEGRITCTKIREMMICNAKGELKFVWNEEKGEFGGFNKQSFSLFKLVRKRLGWDREALKKGPDVWRMRYNELCGVPLDEWPEDAKTYALGDATDTLGVWASQEQEVAPEGIPGEAGQVQAAWALYLMQTWGVRTDPVMVKEYKAEVQGEYNAVAKICVEHKFMRGKGKTKGTKNLKKIRAEVEEWYAEHRDKGFEMKITAKGLIATDREQLMTTDHPGLHAVAEEGRIGKNLKTYVPVLERGMTVPINPNYNPILETFRTSCSGGMKIDKIPVGANVQNMPRGGKVRACYIPREGWEYAACDYDTLEMLTLAQVCLDLFGYSYIAEAARAGQDFHLAFAADMLGISYDDAKARHDDDDPDIARARQSAKISNYGMAGGMGPHAFMNYAKSGYGVVVELELAKKLHRGFRQKWPEMVDYFNHCSFLCDGGNAKHIVFPRSGLVRGDVNFTAVANGAFQHLAAMGAKSAVYQVSKECYIEKGSPLYGSRPVIFAHDEIIMEIPTHIIGRKAAHESAMRLQQVMIEQMVKWVPDVPIGATVTMMLRWRKGAKAVFENGLLVPSKKEGKKWVADV